MIVDTSALVAILFAEPDAARYARIIYGTAQCRISAANFVELSMVVEGQLGAEGGRQSDTLLRRAEIAVEPVTVEQAHIARQAFLDFGKGRHPEA